MEQDVEKEIIEVVTDVDYLRQRSQETTLEEVKQKRIVERIKTALKTTWADGCGLAAVQIGEPIRAAWYRIPGYEEGEVLEKLLINPRLKRVAIPMVFKNEGCLSVPNRRFNTRRYRVVWVESDNHPPFVAQENEAVVIQHELDHMDGILCYDRKIREGVKIGRNEPCPCGSGKKYKKCCIEKEGVSDGLQENKEDKAD